MAVSDAAVRAELWQSLVSVLRTYAAAETLNGKPVAVEELPEGVRLVSGQAELVIRFDVNGGEGNWQSERFRMLPDGTLELPGDAVREFDDMAIEWVAQVSRAGAQAREDSGAER